MKSLGVVAFVLIVSLIQLSEARPAGFFPYRTEYRLRRELASRIDESKRAMVPWNMNRENAENVTGALNLEFGVSLIKILSFDEESGYVKVLTWDKMRWQDDLLAWRPEDYGGITHLAIPSDQIWKPDIHLYNSLDVGSLTDSNVMAMVYSSGDVLFIPPVVSTVHCPIAPLEEHFDADDDDDDDVDTVEGGDRNGTDDVLPPGRKRRAAGEEVIHHGAGDQVIHHGADEEVIHHGDGPHIEHTAAAVPPPEWECTFKFGSWVHDGNEVDINPYEGLSDIDTNDFIQDNAYEIVKTSGEKNEKYYACCADSPYPDLTFKMTFRRR